MAKTRQQLNTLMKKQERESQKLLLREEEEKDRLARWDSKIVALEQKGDSKRVAYARKEMLRVESELRGIRESIQRLEQEKVESAAEYDKITKSYFEFKKNEKDEKRLKKFKMKLKVKEEKQQEKVASVKEVLRDAEAELECNPHKERLQVKVWLAKKRVEEQEVKLQEIRDTIQEIQGHIEEVQEKMKKF